MAYDIINEGKARIAVPKYSGRVVSSAMEVFYNPVMKANRDITLLAMAAATKLYGIKKWNIADMMAASGIRGIRMMLELGSTNIESLKMNDYSAAAVAVIKKNMRLNKIKPGKKVVVTKSEANKFLLANRSFNYIDVDPFGYPGLFLDSAVKKLAHNGLLAVTATDTSALAGTAAAACKRKYLAMPLKNEFMHETGVRIMVRLVQLIGALHEKALVPVFCYYKDHYVRAFFICRTGAHRVDELMSRHKEIFYCRSCCNREVTDGQTNRCRNCGKEMETAGPLWTGRLFDDRLASRMAAAAEKKGSGFDEKLKGFLSTIADEAKHESATGFGFYAIERLCEKNKVARQPKTAEVIKRLRQQGYATSPTHCATTGIKTAAPLKQAVKAVMGKDL